MGGGTVFLTKVARWVAEGHAEAGDVALGAALVGVPAHLACRRDGVNDVKGVEGRGVAVGEDLGEGALPELHGVFYVADVVFVCDEPDVIVFAGVFGEYDVNGVALCEDARVGVAGRALGEGLCGDVAVEPESDLTDGMPSGRVGLHG